jgi:AraC family transcriptional regulator, transcriptional activator of pobA
LTSGYYRWIIQQGEGSQPSTKTNAQQTPRRHRKEEGLQNGLPSVEYLAEQLNVSPRYLSDMLRSLTGQNAQQHIHEKLIEKAKEYLTATSLSVSEIAYQLGFEQPQSFNRLFKKKTNQTPIEFKQSFN